MTDSTISSRTPEGTPNRCPLCGNEVVVEPSLIFGDAPCPHCGQLLWFLRSGLGPVFWQYDVADSLRQGIIARIAELKEFGADSLDTVELIMELEDEFGLDFGDEFPE